MGLLLALNHPLSGQDLKSLGFDKVLAIEIRNTGQVELENYPVTINVEAIRAVAPDFNSYNFGLFEMVGGEFRLIQTQTDDLDQDRHHEEIFFLKTLPVGSTIKLMVYYSSKGSMQLMIARKVFARPDAKNPNENVSWESLFNAWKFDRGRIIPYGKFTKALVLQQMRSEDGRPQGWGMRLVAPDATGGTGGLKVWNGTKGISLYSSDAMEVVYEKPVILSIGPLRTIVRIDYKPVKTGSGQTAVSCLYSQPADTSYTRVDVSLRRETEDEIILGPAIRKTRGETTQLDDKQGFFSAWGPGSPGAGDYGAAVVFRASDFMGLAELDTEWALKFKAGSGKKLTYWLISAWSRGANSPRSPAVNNWPKVAAGLAADLTVPVEISIKPEK